VGEFGDKFRKEREKKNFSLDDVSNVTKIGSRMLQAIEDEHFDQLPGGVFNKGFIRAYAKHLGLDGEEAVTSYLACLRQAQIDAQQAWDPQVRAAVPEKRQPEKRPLDKRAPVELKKPAPTQPIPAAKSPLQVDELPDLQLPRAEHVRPPRKAFAEKGDSGIPWRILAVAAVVIVLAVVLWTRHSRTTRTEAASAPAATQPAPAPIATATSQPSASPANHPAASSSPSAPSPQPSPPAPTLKPPSNAAQNHSRVQSEEQTHNQSEANADHNDVTTRPAAPTKREPFAQPTVLTLVIRASETSWIAVTADGQPLTHETLIAPAHTTIRATREIIVRVGNAAGVSFFWNGQDIPAQGAEGEVKTVVFDAEGIRILPSTPSTDPSH